MRFDRVRRIAADIVGQAIERRRPLNPFDATGIFGACFFACRAGRTRHIAAGFVRALRFFDAAFDAFFFCRNATVRAKSIAVGVNAANQAVAVEDIIDRARGNVIFALRRACGFMRRRIGNGARTIFFGRARTDATGQNEQ